MGFDIDLDEDDQKIVSILRYGEKQQREIIELMNRSEGTVRNHLDYLEEQEVITKTKNGGSFYYLNEGRRKKVKPLPKADPESVNDVLYKMGFHFDLLPSNEFSVPDDAPFSFSELAREFHNISFYRYEVLSSENNFKLFSKIFDHVLCILIDFDNKRETLTDSENSYWLFFRSICHIYENWENGFENSDFHSTISKRTEHMELAFDSSPFNIKNAIQTVLTKIDRRKGQEVLVRLIAEEYSDDENKSGDILDSVFYHYDSENEVHLLFDDLREIKNRIDSEAEKNIDAFIKEYKRRYTTYYS